MEIKSHLLKKGVASKEVMPVLIKPKYRSIQFGLLLLLLASFNLHVLAAVPVYRVGVFDNKPIVFKTKSGQYAGISIDVLNSIAKEENIKFEYIHAPWKNMLAMLRDRKLDLLVGIAYSEKRAQEYDFTQETLINNWGVVYRRRSISITSLQDLRGKRVAMMNGSIHTDAFIKIMKKFSFDYKPVIVGNYLQALKLVGEGKADAAVINRVNSLLNASRYNVAETGIIFNPVEVRMASPKGMHPKLLAMIDKGLAEQKKDMHSVYHKSLKKWLSSSNASVVPRWLKYATGIFVITVLVLVFSNIVIRRRVAQRTAELSESEARFRQLAETINEVFWICSPDWQKIFYISPQFEKVWNLKCNQVYEDAHIWLDSVHPDDRDKLVLDIEKKSAGDLTNPNMPVYRIVTGDGNTRWILARAYPIRNEHDEIIRIAGIAEDITARKEYEDKISYLAMHDSLTRLDNRYAFENNLVNLLQHLSDDKKNHALLYIDLDQFKIVNDTCGHTAGDKMLRLLAAKLKSAVSPYGVVARLGGDEFGVILENTSPKAAKEIAQMILDTVRAFRFTWDDKVFSIGASIGLVIIDADNADQLDLLSAADMACYAAKERGRNRIHIYTYNDAELVKRHGEMQWVSRLNQALDENRFVLHRQGICQLQKENYDEGCACHEYLLRLYDENDKLIFPDTFIPAAERYELMPKIDRWVIANVFHYLRDNEQDKLKNTSEPVAFINLSGQIFSDEKFYQFVISEADKHGINPSNICFEITETAAVGNLLDATQFIRRLRECGFRFALDDFGTGMSSFSYLKTLPLDYLKIDGVFINGLFNDPMNSAIVEAVTKIGHDAGLKIVAEWIENREIGEALARMGVDYGQGYAIEKPGALPNAGGIQMANQRS